MILGGDIGGTKTAVGLYRRGSGDVLEEVRAETYPSARYDGLAPIVEEFLGRDRAAVAGAAFGVAGPVVENTATLTNLPWELDAAALAAATGIPRIDLLNDLVATGEGIPALAPDAVRTLQPGRPLAGGNAVLIAAGTGLGMSPMPWLDGRWHPQPSEGGHQEFGPRNDEEWELRSWLAKELGGRISNERVVSGLGLADIYRFLCQRDPAAASESVAAALAAPGADPARVVGEAATADDCSLARRAVEMFVSLYGSVAGDLALVGLAFGGVWIGGGIAPRLLPFMASPLFLDAFLDKGRFRAHLARMPVRVILDDRAALKGAALHAARAV